MDNLKKTLLVILLMVVVLTPRLSKLDSFVTLDEPFWLSVGGNFYYALGQRELDKTVYEYHPAVTTMWIVTGAFLAYFPEYRGFGQGYFDVDKEKFDPFLLKHGILPIHLLFLGRLMQVAVIVVLALVLYYFLSQMLGEENAFLITAFTSSAPYFLGHSRVLSHESMLAFFVLASIVSLFAYLEAKAGWSYLFVSAACAGLAQLTKSSAVAMLPVIGLMLAVSAVSKMKDQGFGRVIFNHLRIFGLWLFGLILVYIVVWPGMWVDPAKMLYEVYGNAFSYAFQGARLQVTQELNPSTFSLSAPGSMIASFSTSLIRYATPVSWAGLILAGCFLFGQGKDVAFLIYKKLILYLVVTAFMFILLFSVAQGRNSSHYVMTSYVGMDAVAALGWCGLLGWLGMKSKILSALPVRVGFITVLILLQLASAMSFYPYYYTYSNPIWTRITGAVPVSDYGEGFEKAAAYLAQKPGSESLKVLAVRGRGPFSYFFPGETITLNLLFMNETGMRSVVGRLALADYLIVNDAVGRPSDGTGIFMNALSSVTPEISIYTTAAYTIRIYRVSDLPPSFYEAISK